MIDVFIAYSHFDLSYKDELKKFLRPMLREERISLWDDFDIEAGQDWDAKIKERLYGAEIVLLLVSADSLASDYFYSKEVKVSLERHARGETVVVPIILRHCDWTATPLGSLEVLPEKGRPVVDWPTRDQAFLDVVSRLRRVVEALELKRKSATVEAEVQRQFQAACLAADQLYAKQNWREAALAYGSALTSFRPGFTPDRAELQDRQADCETRIRAEEQAEQQRILNEAAARKEQEKRERKPAPKETYQADAPNTPQEWKKEVPMTSPTSNSNRGLWIGLGAGALLIVILMIWRPWAGKNDMGRVSPESTGVTTLPKNGNYTTETPKQSAPTQTYKEPAEQRNATPIRTEVEKRLIEKRIKALLNEADSYIILGKKDRAKDNLNEVLKLDPDNATAKAKLNSLK